MRVRTLRRARRSVAGAVVVALASAMPMFVAAPASAATAGSGPSALVLYDTTGPYAQLGELYAMATANLAGHFGTVKTEPVLSYQSGQISSYTATFYIGSTYDEVNNAPAAFATDVVNATRPVVWMGFNIWDVANKVGPAAFTAKFGWDPTQSYLTTGVTSVTYRGQSLTRTFPAGTDGGVVAPDVVDASKVTTLATATGSSTSFPWALRSGSLTYIGEIPFAYTNETDRVIVLDDLMFDALAPSTAARHRALVRLEDISPASDPKELTNAADYLYKQHVPFGFNVIPVYTDPNGYYNNGTPQTITLSQAPAVVKAIKYLLSHGGTIIDEGYTHQYSNVADPYDGVSGDDCEFFLSHIDANDNVVFDGPVPQDSASWAQGRVSSALAEFKNAGLPQPSIWVTPHYFASPTDYTVFARNYAERYDRGLYFKGTLSGGAIDTSTYIGQFFPYAVTDLYGQKVLPENLGDYEPVEMNNHPPRFPADIVHEAQLNLAVRDGFASFFYDPSNGTQPLSQIVSGIKNLGYTFVAPTAV